VEDAESGFCGAVVGWEFGVVVLEDRFGKRRNFPLRPAAFLLDGNVVTLRKPAAAPAQQQRRITASGSVSVGHQPARVAKASRIWVEGLHDAALVERIWATTCGSRAWWWSRCPGSTSWPRRYATSVRGRGGGSGYWSTIWWRARRRAGSWPR